MIFTIGTILTHDCSKVFRIELFLGILFARFFYRNALLK